MGCTWSSLKWPHLSDDDVVVIRCMVGRRGDNRWTSMTDTSLLRRVRDELEDAKGLVGCIADAERTAAAIVSDRIAAQNEATTNVLTD